MVKKPSSGKTPDILAPPRTGVCSQTPCRPLEGLSISAFSSGYKPALHKDRKIEPTKTHKEGEFLKILLFIGDGLAKEQIA